MDEWNSELLSDRPGPLIFGTSSLFECDGSKKEHYRQYDKTHVSPYLPKTVLLRFEGGQMPRPPRRVPGGRHYFCKISPIKIATPGEGQ
jgi:hypothetical protein